MAGARWLYARSLVLAFLLLFLGSPTLDGRGVAVLWACSGPLSGFNGTWQRFINTRRARRQPATTQEADRRKKLQLDGRRGAGDGFEDFTQTRERRPGGDRPDP